MIRCFGIAMPTGIIIPLSELSRAAISPFFAVADQIRAPKRYSLLQALPGHASLDAVSNLFHSPPTPSTDKMLFEFASQSLFNQHGLALNDTEVDLLMDSCFTIGVGHSTLLRPLVKAWKLSQPSVKRRRPLAIPPTWPVLVIGIEPSPSGLQHSSRDIGFVCEHGEGPKRPEPLARSATISASRWSDQDTGADQASGKPDARSPAPDDAAATATTRSSLARRAGRSRAQGHQRALLPARPTSRLSLRCTSRTRTPRARRVSKLVEWIRSLNPNPGLRLNGVYQSQSTYLILEAAWEVWAQLNGLAGFSLVLESLGGNLLPQILA